MFLTSSILQGKACLGEQQLQTIGIHQTCFRLWRCKQAFIWSTSKGIYDTCGGQSGEVFGNELPRSSAAVPVQKSPDEGFGKDRSWFCCVFRHTDEWKTALDAWGSTLTDVLCCSVNGLLGPRQHPGSSTSCSFAPGFGRFLPSQWHLTGCPVPSAALMFRSANCKTRSLPEHQHSSWQGDTGAMAGLSLQRKNHAEVEHPSLLVPF